MSVDIEWDGIDPLPNLRQRLIVSRRAGASFDTAWPRALAHLSTRDRRAIEGTTTAWRSAFEREAPTQAEAAMRHLHELLASPPSDRNQDVVVA
jgi:hypothetical protein